PERARESLETAARLNPRHVRVHHQLGQACALTGDLESAWNELSWPDADGLYQRFEQPTWDGTELRGGTILFWSTSSLSETIQLVRFASTVKDLGARVILECSHRLLPLVEQAGMSHRSVAANTPLPSFDVHAPLMRLPQIFRTGWQTIPAR